MNPSDARATIREARPLRPGAVEPQQVPATQRDRMAHNQGCKCRECYGLAEYMLDQGRDATGLPRMPGHSRALLRVVTLGEDIPSVELAACTGTMTCICTDCAAERERVVKRGVRPRRPLPVRRAA